jgi:GTP cyclohydrolase I
MVQQNQSKGNKLMSDETLKDTWLPPEPISQTIKKRVEQAGSRYYAANNISEFIKEGEKEKLIEEVTEKFNAVLDSLIIDRENDPNSKNTGKRLAKMYINEIMGGRYNHAPEVTTFPNEDGRYDQLIVVRCDIKSMCSHHHQPVSGVCYIGCLPGKRLIGLSKYSRIAQHQAARGHLQEELTEKIAFKIQQLTESPAVGVYMRARHGCCENRGIRSANSSTQTTVLKGLLKTDATLKNEFMHNIELQENNCRGQ